MAEHPPEDVAAMIEKIAAFVARNGPEFERMTMEKQQHNPKFAFMFGGEHHSFYRWKIAQEQLQLSGFPQGGAQPTQYAPPPGHYGGSLPPHMQQFSVAPPQATFASQAPLLSHTQAYALPPMHAHTQPPPPPPHHYQQAQPPPPPSHALPQTPAPMSLLPHPPTVSERVRVSLSLTDWCMHALDDVMMQDDPALAIAASTRWCLRQVRSDADAQLVAQHLLTLARQPGLAGSAARVKVNLLHAGSDLLHHAQRKGRTSLVRHIAAALPLLVKEAGEAGSRVCDVWIRDPLPQAPALAQALALLRTPDAPAERKPEYYDLPAGLMVPLVKEEDCSYAPIDASRIVPQTYCEPDARITAAVEAFYNARPTRDDEGWDKTALRQHFERKRRHLREQRARPRSPVLVPQRRSPSPVRGGFGLGGDTGVSVARKDPYAQFRKASS